MAHPERSVALQTIFSFFLGLMVTAFIGVGVYTFHPPDTSFDRQLRDIDQEEQAIVGFRAPPTELTEAEEARMRELADARRAVFDASEAARRAWGRSTSIILIAFATLAMAVSLVRADKLPVISNGLLLGGVFTMVYGVGWIVTSDASVTRFLVMTVALAITLALGYARFVRPRAALAAVGGELPMAAYGSDGLADVERRLRDLERRMAEAAGALGPRND